MGRQNFLST